MVRLGSDVTGRRRRRRRHPRPSGHFDLAVVAGGASRSFPASRARPLERFQGEPFSNTKNTAHINNDLLLDRL